MQNTRLTDEEIQRLNEEIFEEEKEHAWNCPHRSHMSVYTCDGCDIIQACSSLPKNGYYE